MLDICITGVAEAPQDSAPGIGGLYADLARRAVADAGVELGAVDGLITIVPRADPLVWHADAVADMLGLRVRFVASVAQGGSAVLTTLLSAAAAIDAGRASRVLIAGADLLRSGLGRSAAVASMADTAFRRFERCYGLAVPSAFALMAARYLHDFGASSDDLAAVAVTMRGHAAAHPLAQAKDPLTIEDVLESRMISSPLHLYDCSLVSDGGGALVVERRSDTPRAVNVLSCAEAHSSDWVTTGMPWEGASACAAASAAALMEAGLSAGDVDVALIYDPFSIVTLVALEDIGFCSRGEGGALASAGAISATGSIPVNPHGGLLSHSHPGRPGALLHLVEAVRQVRGDALGLQIAGAQVALVTAEGAMLGAYATTVLAR
jgi:acetyl-CoA acetyltransferase